MDTNKPKLHPKEVFYHLFPSDHGSLYKKNICKNVNNGCSSAVAHISASDAARLFFKKVKVTPNPWKDAYIIEDGQEKPFIARHSLTKSGGPSENCIIPANTLIIHPHAKDPSASVTPDIIKAHQKIVTDEKQPKDGSPKKGTGRLLKPYSTTPTKVKQLLGSGRKNINGRENCFWAENRLSFKETSGRSRKAGTLLYPKGTTVQNLKDKVNSDPDSAYFIVTTDKADLKSLIGTSAFNIMLCQCKAASHVFESSPYLVKTGAAGCRECVSVNSSGMELRIRAYLNANSHGILVKRDEEAHVKGLKLFGNRKNNMAKIDYLLPNKVAAELDAWPDHNAAKGIIQDSDKTHMLLDGGYYVIRARYGSGKKTASMLNINHPKYREFDASGMTDGEIAAKFIEIYLELMSL